MILYKVWCLSRATVWTAKNSQNKMNVKYVGTQSGYDSGVADHWLNNGMKLAFTPMCVDRFNRHHLGDGSSSSWSQPLLLDILKWDQTRNTNKFPEIFLFSLAGLSETRTGTLNVFILIMQMNAIFYSLNCVVNVKLQRLRLLIFFTWIGRLKYWTRPLRVRLVDRKWMPTWGMHSGPRLPKPQHIFTVKKQAKQWACTPVWFATTEATVQLKNLNLVWNSVVWVHRAQRSLKRYIIPAWVHKLKTGMGTTWTTS